MTTRYDICAPRPKKDGTTYWHKIGAMYPNEKGGFSLRFDSLPIPNDKGEVMALAFEPREQQGNGKPARQQSGGAAKNHSRDLNDDIPWG